VARGSGLLLLCPLGDGPDRRARGPQQPLRARPDCTRAGRRSGIERSGPRCAALEDLATNVGVDLRDRIVVEEQFSVSEFADRYNAEQGSALGLAHTLRQTGPLRPDHRSSALDGLYFTGGFTRPGIGVPMCLISGEHAASAVLDDLDDDRRIQRPA